MKKTIIAAAIATVIAAPAMADVSVSGVVEQAFASVDTTATDATTTAPAINTATANAADQGWQSQPDNSITFKASEDLGNGMTAFAQITLDTDNGSASKDEKVGLKGGFGTVVVGRMEDFTEGVMAATMTMNGASAGIELAGNAGRDDGAIAYVSPTVNGIHAGIAGYTGTGAANSDAFDAVDMIVAYDNGPLSLKLSQETLNTTVSDGTDEQSTTSVSAKYGMGDISVAALWVDRENQGGSNAAAADYDDLMLRLDYKMGNNKITVAHADDGSTKNQDVLALELTHSMSKRTSVYVGHSQKDKDATLTTAGSLGADVDSTYFGMIHKF